MDITKDIDEAKAESFILIKFRGLGDGQPEIYFNNINAFQVLGSASALEVHGKNWFIKQENERAELAERTKLSVAKPEILKP